MLPKDCLRIVVYAFRERQYNGVCTVLLAVLFYLYFNSFLLFVVVSLDVPTFYQGLYILSDIAVDSWSVSQTVNVHNRQTSIACYSSLFMLFFFPCLPREGKVLLKFHYMMIMVQPVVRG